MYPRTVTEASSFSLTVYPLASSAAVYFSPEKADIPDRTARQSCLMRALFSSNLYSVRFQPCRRLTSSAAVFARIPIRWCCSSSCPYRRGYSRDGDEGCRTLSKAWTKSSASLFQSSRVQPSDSLLFQKSVNLTPIEESLWPILLQALQFGIHCVREGNSRQIHLRVEMKYVILTC